MRPVAREHTWKTADADPVPTEQVSPYGTAVVLISMLYHSSAGFYSYIRFHESGQTGFILGCIGSSLLGAFGLWCLLFGSTPGRISKRTGADKRTSGFPLRNAEADKRKAKGQ